VIVGSMPTYKDLLGKGIGPYLRAAGTP